MLSALFPASIKKQMLNKEQDTLKRSKLAMVWIDLMTLLPSATPWFLSPQGFFSAGDLRHMDAHLVDFY